MLIKSYAQFLWISVYFLCTNSFATDYPWTEPKEPVPEVKPFQLPKLQGDTQFQDPVPSLLPAPEIDPDSIYQNVLNCYPEVSTFKIDVDLVAGYRQVSDKYSSSSWPDLSEHYVGIVGKIPLVSNTEDSRARDREFKRRTAAAKFVAGFAQALANRNHAYRELGLYMALEARAVTRVERGLAPTSEQVDMMIKVAASQRNITKYSAEAVENRLALMAMCDDQKGPGLNDYLKRVANLPNTRLKEELNR